MTGFIYVVECGQRIKIGFSKKPELRFSKIASDAPFPCNLLGYWPGTVADELEIHAKFQALRVHGEWFASTEGLLSFIADSVVPHTATDRDRFRAKEGDGPLTARRKSQRLTLAAFGSRVGVDKSTVLRWERHGVPADRLAQVETATGIPRWALRPDIFGSAPTPQPEAAK